jgi:hypothetical protein
MRFCPKCRDYYADDSLPFCLADGTPLVNIDPNSETWDEGSRVIETKEKTSREQYRKQKRRRVLISVVTVLMIIMVLCVVTINSLIYLRPPPPECSIEDRGRETKIIDALLRRRIESEPPADFVRFRPTLNIVKSDVVLSETCREADVTIDYEWRIEPHPTIQNPTVRGKRSFTCTHTADTWHCS